MGEWNETSQWQGPTSCPYREGPRRSPRAVALSDVKSHEPLKRDLCSSFIPQCPVQCLEDLWIKFKELISLLKCYYYHHLESPKIHALVIWPKAGKEMLPRGNSLLSKTIEHPVQETEHIQYSRFPRSVTFWRLCCQSTLCFSPHGQCSEGTEIKSIWMVASSSTPKHKWIGSTSLHPFLRKWTLSPKGTPAPPWPSLPPCLKLYTANWINGIIWERDWPVN